MSASPFFQDPPQLGNQYTADRLLQSYLRRTLPREVHAAVEPDLTRLGERVVTDIAAMAADAVAHEPVWVPYDAWGRRIDHIEVTRGWVDLDRTSAEEGLIAIGYERKYGEYSRVYQFAKLYLFNPSSAVYTCPLSMADGAARALEVHAGAALRDRALPRLVTRDPAKFWTSGQWMTERTGGSDVGGTSTVARRDGDGWRLYGTKWFTSSTTSQMAFTLARIEDAVGQTTSGSRGLSLFYLETRDERGALNRIVIHRLKDKLGTRSLPTAELSLEGTPAELVGESGHGVRNIATLMNITRVYNTLAAASGMRRGVALVRDYSARRRAFGKLLAEHPLHLETLAQLEVDCEAAFHLLFDAVRLLGREECGQATADECLRLRLLTPLVKLFTARLCVASTSEVLEAFGGAGYVEDTGLPAMLRDAQVLSIWEGTTNVLSLDLLRAIERDGAFEPFLVDLRRRLAAIEAPMLRDAAAGLQQAAANWAGYLPQALAEGADALQAGARSFAYGLSKTYAGLLLLEHAQWSLTAERDGRAAAAALRWCDPKLTPWAPPDAAARERTRALALDLPLAVPAERALAGARG